MVGVRKLWMAAAIAAALLAAPMLGVAGAANGSNSSLNQPDYYEGLGYGTCTKTETPGDPYNLGAAPGGKYWTLLVLKAGSASSNDDWNTMVPSPTPGPYVHPSGKSISHVINCYKNGSGPGPTTTLPASSTTVPGGDCSSYTPTHVAVDPPTASPGDAITISGVASPGDTLTATLSGNSSSPSVLGSATADGSGQFQIVGVVPAPLPEGTYTVTVTSQTCPTSVQVSLVIYALKFSGCGYNNEGRTFFPGQKVQWTFHDSSFNTSQPVRLVVTKTGTTYNLFGFGPWPASNQVEVTIPLTAPTGKYSMDQTGEKPNGKSQTKSCPIWIEKAPKPVLATSAPAGSGGLDVPVGVIAVGAISVGSLVRLRLRRRLS